MSQTVFSGPLRPKRKAELMSIAEALQINSSESLTKVDLENNIKQALYKSEQAQQDPRFAGLWSVIGGHDRRSNHRSDTSEGDNGQDETESPRASRRASAGRTKVMERAQKVLEGQTNAAAETLEDSVHAAEAAGREMVVAATREAQPYKKQLAIFNQKQLIPALHTIQKTLSSAWTLIGITLLAELLFILGVSIPYTARTMQGTPWAFFKLTPDHPWTLTLPDYGVLSQFSFWRIICVWAFTSFVVPVIASMLVTFPKPTRGLGKASPLSFSIVRLVLGVYLERVATAPLVDYSGTVVERFADFQLLAASTGLAFALYEVIA